MQNRIVKLLVSRRVRFESNAFSFMAISATIKKVIQFKFRQEIAFIPESVECTVIYRVSEKIWNGQITLLFKNRFF